MSTEDRPGWGRGSDDPPRREGSDERPPWRPAPEERPAWRPEPEPSASGGHLSPDPGSGSMFDPLGGPLPSEVAARAQPERSTESVSRTDVIPRGRPEATKRPPPGARRRPGFRRIKRTIRHVDPMSVLKLSLFFYATFLVLWLVLVALIYAMLESAGLFNTIEDLSRAFVLDWDSNISLFFVERWALLVGLTIGVLGSLLNVFLAFLYNVAADIVGGIEMTFAERDH